jgi:ribosomal protein S18 acetylase RimI-like enzyme
LRPFTEDELSAFVESDLEHYIEERVNAGEPRDVARRVATEQIEGLFPDGRPAPRQLLFRVVDDDGNAVGTLWVGPRQADRPEAFWVWDVEIDEAHRGKGYGRAAMVLAEAEALHCGASELGLNVFGHNHAARRLYESLGYTATSTQMRKAL